MVKNPPAVQEPQETRIQSLCGQSTCSLEESIGAWRIPMDRGDWWAIFQRAAESQTRLK